MSRGLCVGRPDGGAADLADALAVPLHAVPAVDDEVLAATVETGSWAWTDSIEAWAGALASGEPLDRIVVATWSTESAAAALTELDDRRWAAAVEHELALWARAIVAVTERAADGASIVIVVDRPSPLDAAGHAPALAVAEGLRTFGRSAALVAGERMIRVNTVATSLGTDASALVGMAPALPTFPGTIRQEAAGAVRALWSEDTIGMSGTLLAVDGGRSW